MPDKEKAEAPPKNLRQKLLAAQSEVERVEKRGENKQQNYAYATAADIIEAARKVLSKHGVAFSATERNVTDLEGYQTRNGATMNVVRVKMGFFFADIDGDAQLVVEYTGEGQDTGDKALNKARTAAIKYCLQQNLLIPTGDDPEEDAKEHDGTRVRVEPEGKTCPKCGNVGSLRQNRSGIWQCWGSKGGCEAIFTPDAMDVYASGKNGSEGTGTQTKGTSEDDGQVDPDNEPITSGEVDELLALIKLSSNPDATLKTLLKQCGNASGLDALIHRQYRWAKETLRKKINEKAEKAAAKTEEGEERRARR